MEKVLLKISLKKFKNEKFPSLFFSTFLLSSQSTHIHEIYARILAKSFRQIKCEMSQFQKLAMSEYLTPLQRKQIDWLH